MWSRIKADLSRAAEDVNKQAKLLSAEVSSTLDELDEKATFLKKQDSWNAQFYMSVLALKTAVNTVPHNITAIRLLTDHAIPKVILPDGMTITEIEIGPRGMDGSVGLKGELYMPQPGQCDATQAPHSSAYVIMGVSVIITYVHTIANLIIITEMRRRPGVPLGGDDPVLPRRSVLLLLVEDAPRAALADRSGDAEVDPGRRLPAARARIYF